MKYLLDTNICIYFFKGLYNLDKKFEVIGYENFSISEITYAELIYGAENSQNIEKNTVVVESFISKIDIIPIFDSIKIYAKEKSRLRSNGNIISDFDLLIGATAITNNLTLITRNINEFERLNDLKLLNWIDS